MCVAVEQDTKCHAPTPDGFKYCEKHKDRPRAVRERLVHTVTDMVTGERTGVDSDPEFTTTIVRNEQELTGNELLKKVSDMVGRTIDFENFAFKKVQELGGDIRFKDKAGAEQLRSEVAVYERALDRSIRALTGVTKLGIDAQLANASKAQYEIVKTALMKTLMRLGLDAEQLASARSIMAEEFAKVYKAS